MTTTAIVCIARNETPFTAEWLEYHFKIGIDRVYYISTDSDFTQVKAFFEGSKFRSRVELLHFDSFNPGWQMRCYDTYFPLVKEDWVLVIDIDEFLYLNSFSNIREFLKTVDKNVGQIQFPWLNVMSNDYCHEHIFDILNHSEKYVSDHVKSMVRRRCASGLGIHAHGIIKSKNCLSSGFQISAKPRFSFLFDDIQYYNNHPFVLHFYSRGHFDVLNRIMDHQFFNTKNGPIEQNRVLNYLQYEANWSNIPTRYMLMQFYLSLPKANVQCSMPKIESRTDVSALKKIFMSIMNKKIEFDDADLENIETRFENRYHLAHKFLSLDLSAICDRNGYLKCNTQYEYIDKLRKSLDKIRKLIWGAP
ncbi:glycosyltransferase family 2 protein [candidate division CSSED10-310 bacterium]|uniref:Glycosyltransferase family 2 protein n=1 Tax=candidate division CSSED10-310 bacterium TaxID=2855610 RepID=A0ABV6Z1G2_UNCC1